jgi:hypothetical protein
MRARSVVRNNDLHSNFSTEASSARIIDAIRANGRGTGEFQSEDGSRTEAKGQPHEMLEAEEKTANEEDQIRRRLIQQGWTPQQALWTRRGDRERYIFLPPGADASS